MSPALLHIRLLASRADIWAILFKNSWSLSSTKLEIRAE
jgi:hypothetical protein